MQRNSNTDTRDGITFLTTLLFFQCANDFRKVKEIKSQMKAVCCVVLCCVVLCCVVLCYVVLCCVLLLYVALCCVVLCCVTSQMEAVQHSHSMA
jgi:uncharacterized membrane protein YbaN (DUF454 family)